MEPQAAAEVCAQAAATLAQAMTQTTSSGALRAQAEGLSAVAAHMEPQAAAEVCAQAAATLAQAMTQTTSSGALRAQAEGLSAVLTGVDPTNQRKRTVAVTTTFGAAAAGTSRLVPLPLLQPALEPLPRGLPDSQLVELLKNPLCVGRARRVVLDVLGARHGRRFEDQWDFVRFAQERQLGLDFTSPARRPGF
jgi:hypothetical protein